ncbi:PepSY-associated TM helix domain-containing protein [Arthrospiribacter ruber]|uniref:PepSY domain-containing protein n=1 Tax=Arthrospiribacter ruber TaxID=2487934 RepID=A0A951ITG4_9BACT|nr:PepSY-associated TM helix domain-containing protein [Arthrospiribacter ruber]MBW3466978.1 PepSY domain-containing protein [Arthrospiribacter ruber]
MNLLKPLIKKLHLWLGLASGLVVVILGITGCIYVFEEELKQLVYQQRYTAGHSGQAPLPLEDLLPIAQEALGKDKLISSVKIPAKPGKSYHFSTYKTNPTGWNYFNTSEYYLTAYVNPYSGEILMVENTRLEFFRIVLWIHYNLLLGNIGKQIVGWSTVVFILLLISGLVLWWPKNKAAAKQRYWFRWKSSTKFKRKNYDLHNILGFYILSLGLIIALTGLVWAFTWFSTGVDWLANGGKNSPKRVSEYADFAESQYEAGIHDLILSDLKQKNPEADRYEIRKLEGAFPFQGLTLYKNSFQRHRFDIYQYHPETAKVLEQLTYTDKTKGEKYRSMNYPIHVGSILGLPGKILAFFASLIASSLPVTGFMIWYNRVYGKMKSKNHRMQWQDNPNTKPSKEHVN